MQQAQNSLSLLDYQAILAYFLITIGASIFSVFGNKRNTVDSYYLAGRQMSWMFIGASLFACNIGSEHFIGLAGSGAASGIGVGAFEINALIIIQLLGWVFLPVYIASGVATLPEYMNKRFGGNRIRVYLSFLSLILYIFTKISVNLYSGGLFIKIALGWNLYYSIFLVLSLTAICTMTGVLKAVIYIDFLQTFIMVAGGLTLMAFSFREIGGVQNLYPMYMNSSFEYLSSLEVNSSKVECSMPKKNAFQMLRDIGDSELPWLGFLLGQTPGSIWYWCSDQMTVQRTLAAKSLSHAQGGTLFAGYLKILPFFMMVIPGMISRALYPATVGCSDPTVCMEVCGSPNGCSNIAYPMLVLNILPDGLKGILLAVMLAALMSDLTSIFNTSSTLFTCDIYKYFKKNATNKELMIVGRLFVLFMVLVGILWIPVIQNMQGAQLYIYIQSVAAYLSPPIASVFILSMLWKGINEKGAFWGLMIGLVVGVLRMVLEFVYVEPPCGSIDTRPFFIKNFHYMYFAMSLFAITSLTATVVSLATKKLPSFRLVRTTFWTRKLTDKRPDEKDDFRVDKNDLILTTEPIPEELNEKEKTLKSETVSELKSNVFSSAMSSIFGLTDLDNKQVQLIQSQDESQRRIDAFNSLNQTKSEKIVLNLNLFLILGIAVGLFTVFSLPVEYSVFRW